MPQLEGYGIKGKDHMVCTLKKFHMALNKLLNVTSFSFTEEVSQRNGLTFDQVVTSFGLKENVVNQCIYLKVIGSIFIIFTLQRCILLASSDFGLLIEIKQYLVITFEMNDLSEASSALGIEIYLMVYWV